MISVYVNINNSYTTDGDGTALNPLQWSQFLIHTDALNEDCTYNLMGVRSFNPPTSYTTANIRFNDADHSISVIIQPWNRETNGPWVIDHRGTSGSFNYWGIYDYTGYCSLTIDGGSIYTYNTQLYLPNVVVNPTRQNIVKCCYFSSNTYIMFYADSGATVPFRFDGCTFHSRVVDYLEVKIGAAGDGEFRDCYFDGLYNIDVDTTPFKHCYFETSTADLNDWNVVRDADCVEGYAPTGDLPLAYNAIEANKTSFDYSTIGLPIITDAAILARWSTDNYNQGLWGNTRVSVGAFYFPSATPTPTPSVTASIPKTYTEPRRAVDRIIRETSLNRSVGTIFQEDNYLREQKKFSPIKTRKRSYKDKYGKDINMFQIRIRP